MGWVVSIGCSTRHTIAFNAVKAIIVLQQPVLSGCWARHAKRPQADAKPKLMNHCVFHNSGYLCRFSRVVRFMAVVSRQNRWFGSQHISLKRIVLLGIVEGFELFVLREG